MHKTDVMYQPELGNSYGKPAILVEGRVAKSVSKFVNSSITLNCFFLLDDEIPLRLQEAADSFRAFHCHV